MTIFDFSRKSTYSRGAARYSDLLYLCLKDRKLDRQSVPHSRLIAIDAGEWAPLADMEWATAGMCVVRRPKEKLVVVSPQGAVFTYVGGTQGQEQITPEPFDLRGAATVDGLAYAFGMKREVYCRQKEGRWVAMSAPPPDGDDEVAGFEALSGFDAQDLYAVGWEGEIWHWTDKRWQPCASPVNVVLTAVCCAPDGQVYACGQNGTLLAGRGDRWAVLEHEVVDDFWDLCWFNGVLLVASMSGLYELAEDGLVPVRFGDDQPDSCYRLTEAEGVLWSIGQEDLFSFDGQAWKRWD